MEIWLSIKNYEGLYLVSNTGKVKSAITNKVLKGTLTSTKYTKYRFVQLYKENTKRVNAYIHLLVYDTFVGKDRTGYTVDHIDNDQENNHIDNLQLITHRVNCTKDKECPGIYYHKKKDAWIARIQIAGKMTYLGINKDKNKSFEIYKKALNSFGGV